MYSRIELLQLLGVLANVRFNRRGRIDIPVGDLDRDRHGTTISPFMIDWGF
jgi:hypothetical protein